MPLGSMCFCHHFWVVSRLRSTLYLVSSCEKCSNRGKTYTFSHLCRLRDPNSVKKYPKPLWKDTASLILSVRTCLPKTFLGATTSGEKGAEYWINYERVQMTAIIHISVYCPLSVYVCKAEFPCRIKYFVTITYLNECNLNYSGRRYWLRFNTHQTRLNRSKAVIVHEKLTFLLSYLEPMGYH